MPNTEQLDQFAQARALPPGHIADIDLNPLFSHDRHMRGQVYSKIEEACLQTGFFHVHNSGVQKQTIEAALSAATRFFSKPDDRELKLDVHNRHAGGMKGWGPLFGEPAYQKGTLAHVESFDIGQQLGDETYRRLGIEPNIWPELDGFRDAVLNYYDEVTLLGRAISSVLSEILGEDRDFINARSGETAPRTMRMLHYPGSDSPQDPNHVGISAHTDFECFTILFQTAPGLELTNVQGEWCQAPSESGRFTIILGDMLERFSNGYLSATGHRVSITPWTRYSFVLFFAVDNDYRVEPLPRFVSRNNPSRYRAVTQGSHIEQELRRAAANAGQDDLESSSSRFDS